jgi:phosphatidate cytidylyltransferase
MSPEDRSALQGTPAELKPLSNSGLLAISATLFGLFYVPWLLNFIQKIALYPEFDGRFYVLYFILVTKFSDLGAYTVGSMIGRHKMIPRISPGKTWEGVAGGVAAAIVMAAVAHYWFFRELPLKFALPLAVVMTVVGIFGDLAESALKRGAGAKDAATILPGHGGLLDRLDSLLFNAPLIYYFARFYFHGLV